MSAVPRTLTFGSGERRFLVAERLVPMSHVGFETMDAYAGQAALKRALANEPALAVGMQRTFTGLFPAQGLNACSLSALGCTATDMVARRSLVLIDMGPRPIIVASVDPKLAQPPPGERSFVSKLEAVVRGMTAVPRDRIAADAREDFDHLRRELLSATGVIATIVFVLAFWAASHVTGVVGLILDGVLIGIVWYAIGSAVFAWFDKLAALLFAIRDAKTEAQLAECSAKLVNLILEAGVTTFMTLITRAAGRKLPKVTKGNGSKTDDARQTREKIEPVQGRGATQAEPIDRLESVTKPPADPTPNNMLPDKDGQLKHIFRDAKGHLPDTPENRALLNEVARDPKAILGPDQFKNVWSAKTLPNGTQVWTQVRNGKIINGGLNLVPKAYNPTTGLSAITKP